MKKRILAITACMLISIMVSSCSKSVEQQIAEQLELGQRYLAELNYEEAIVAFQKVIELEPNEAEAYMGLISAYEGTGQKEEAADVIKECHDRFLLSNDKLRESEIDEIIQISLDFYKNQNQLEDRWTFIKELNDLYPENKKYESIALEVRSDLYNQYIRLADESLNFGKERDALEYLQKAYELLPDSDIDIRIKALQNGGEYLAEDGYLYDAFGNKKDILGKSQEELFEILSEEFPYELWGQAYRDYDLDGNEELFADGRNSRDDRGFETYHICYCSSDGKIVQELDAITDSAGWVRTGWVRQDTGYFYYIAFSDSKTSNLEDVIYSRFYFYGLENGEPRKMLSIEGANIAGGENSDEAVEELVQAQFQQN